MTSSGGLPSCIFRNGHRAGDNHKLNAIPSIFSERRRPAKRTMKTTLRLPGGVLDAATVCLKTTQFMPHQEKRKKQ
jgi:hypothetical protein